MSSEALPAKGSVIFKLLHIFGFSAGNRRHLGACAALRKLLHVKSKLEGGKAMKTEKQRWNHRSGFQKR